MQDHRLIDARSLDMHRLIAARIAHDPGILDRARRTIARWRPMASSRSQPYLDRWQELLDAGATAVIAKLSEVSEDGDCMRQSSPFTGVVSNEERWAFIRKWSEIEANTRAVR